MKAFLLLLLFTFYSALIDAQEPHEHPDHLRGNNSNDQYLALPYYNEACEHYQHGDINRTKRSLYEAINESFALTEAQLFLGSLFYKEGRIDSALLYLNSGIDFAIKQKPHFYFMMFETGLIMEEYDLVKHNFKHFKKLYGKKDFGRYEKDYPYTVDDYETIDNALATIFDYKNWIHNAETIDSLTFNHDLIFDATDNNIIYQKDQVLYESMGRKGHAKSKKLSISLPENTLDIRFSDESNFAFITIAKDSDTTIHFAQKENDFKTWKKLPKAINTGKWNGTPFFVEASNLLYFSSSRNKNKDLYVAQVDLSTNAVQHIEPLDRINTKGDEINPVFVNDHFYFASNGHPGFGGFDLFQTENYSIVNDILTPSNAFNMGKPYNTGQDEKQIIFLDNMNHVIHRQHWKGFDHHILMKFKPQKDRFNVDIKIVDLPKDIE